MPPTSDRIRVTTTDAADTTAATHRIDSGHSARAATQSVSPLGSANGRMAPKAIETPQISAPDRAVHQQAHPSRDNPSENKLDSGHLLHSTARPEHAPLDTSLLCVAHAEDLLDQIQRLSEDLDARSAKLQADIAVQERRERAFRLWAQQRSEEIRDKRQACDQEAARLLAQARRLALTPVTNSLWDR